MLRFVLTVQNSIGIFAGHCLERARHAPENLTAQGSATRLWGVRKFHEKGAVPRGGTDAFPLRIGLSKGRSPHGDQAGERGISERRLRRRVGPLRASSEYRPELS